MTEETARILGGAIIAGCCAIAIGLALSKPPRISGTAIGWLGEEIGEGIAHAACIEAGREWVATGYCRK